MGWLFKITIALVIPAVLLFDAISIGTSHLRITDDANLVAATARDALDAPGGTAAKALATGRRAALVAGYTLGPRDITVVKDGIVVRLSEEADTIVVAKLPVAKQWAFVETVAQARSIHTAQTR